MLERKDVKWHRKDSPLSLSKKGETGRMSQWSEGGWLSNVINQNQERQIVGLHPTEGTLQVNEKNEAHKCKEG